jgi:hypothetical protein
MSSFFFFFFFLFVFLSNGSIFSAGLLNGMVFDGTGWDLLWCIIAITPHNHVLLGKKEDIMILGSPSTERNK